VGGDLAAAMLQRHEALTREIEELARFSNRVAPLPGPPNRPPKAAQLPSANASPLRPSARSRTPPAAGRSAATTPRRTARGEAPLSFTASPSRRSGGGAAAATAAAALASPRDGTRAAASRGSAPSADGVQREIEELERQIDELRRSVGAQ